MFKRILSLVFVFLFAITFVSFGKTITVGAEDSVYSLTKQILHEYQLQHPNYHFKIIEMDIPRLKFMKHKPDIVISEDTWVLKYCLENNKNFKIIPWFINSIVIIHKKGIKFTKENWMKVLQHIKYGYSNPETDPLGYYAYFIFDLYNMKYGTHYTPHTAYLRDETTDLVWLFRVGKLDAVFTYKSFTKGGHFTYFEPPKPFDLSICENEKSIKYIRKDGQIIPFHCSTVGIAYKKQYKNIVEFMLKKK